jgi:hypothetical protein
VVTLGTTSLNTEQCLRSADTACLCFLYGCHNLFLISRLCLSFLCKTPPQNSCCIPNLFRFPIYYFFFAVALRRNAGHGLLILYVYRSHTTTHRSPLVSSGRVISPSQRTLPDNTQHSQHTNIHATPGGIRTHNLSKRVAADPRLRPRSHWDRPYINSLSNIFRKQQIIWFIIVKLSVVILNVQRAGIAQSV